MMKWLRVLAVSLLVGVMSPVAGQSTKAPIPEGRADFTQILTKGAELLKARRPAEAIPYFDRVIAGFREKYKGQRVFCSRTQAETLHYLTQAAQERKTTKVVSNDWAYAHYMKAYALIELRRMPEAKEELVFALILSPQNSQFLSELGHVYQTEKNWRKSLQYFQRAEEAAKHYSPETRKAIERARAMRGIAYNYIEMGKWDEAEAIYRRCLEMDPGDKVAANQLEYIKVKRGKQ